MPRFHLQGLCSAACRRSTFARHSGQYLMLSAPCPRNKNGQRSKAQNPEQAFPAGAGGSGYTKSHFASLCGRSEESKEPFLRRGFSGLWFHRNNGKPEFLKYLKVFLYRQIGHSDRSFVFSPCVLQANKI